jgi:DNA-3-methyladenine glycosylase II
MQFQNRAPAQDAAAPANILTLSPALRKQADRLLAEVDPVMARIIADNGPCTLKPEGRRTPFESLVRAIVHQQLHGAAAEAILGRLLALFPGEGFPKPADFSPVPDEALRAAGLSAAKVASLRDLAQKTMKGVVPGPRKIRSLPDDDIVERLTQVRGVGRWTVEMLLIFQLGRADVLPVDDFGIRNAIAKAYGLPALPKPREALLRGEIWRPHRTVAAWHLWSSVNGEAKV